MNNCDSFNTNNKPAHVSDEEWFAIDLNDPLMMVC